jgi:hypothetical protein
VVGAVTVRTALGAVMRLKQSRRSSWGQADVQLTDAQTRYVYNVAPSSVARLRTFLKNVWPGCRT